MKKKNSILIFGASSDLFQKFRKFKKIFDCITVSSKNSKKYDYPNFNYESYDFEYLSKEIKGKNIKYIIIFNGYFKNESDEITSYRINYQIPKSIINFMLKNKKPKQDLRIISITSLDSIHANTNDINYSLYKSLISKYILNMRLKYKFEKIQFDDLMLGAINTKMRVNKNRDGISALEIEKLIFFLISLDIKTTLNPIKIFPKFKSYLEY